MYSTRKSKLLSLSFVTALVSAWSWTPVMAQGYDDYDYESTDTTTTSDDSTNGSTTDWNDSSSVDTTTDTTTSPDTSYSTGTTVETGTTDTNDTTGTTDVTGTTDTSGQDSSYEDSSDGSNAGISGDDNANPTETEQLGDDGTPVASATADDGSLAATPTETIDETFSTPTPDDLLTPTTTDDLLTQTTTDAFLTPTTTDALLSPTSEIVADPTSIDSLISASPTTSPTATTSAIADSSSGLSSTNKAIIGGVVGGVGGIVLLGAIVFIALRRSKRSRRQSDLEVFQPRNDNYEVPFASGEKHEWDGGSQSSPSMAQHHQPYGMSAVSLHPQQY